MPALERERLFPHLKLVPMPLGKVLYESGAALRHIYFPTNSIVSLLYVMQDGASAEIAVVGNEGVIGVALFMGGETTPSRAIVQSAGFAYRLTGERLKQEFNRHGEMLHMLLRYTQSLITQMAQTAVCNRHHSLDQQLCRWLLLSLDRLAGNQLKMTQELIANMLGVRREGVTEAAGKLQKLGVIHYAAAQITVLDRPQLEELSCECYARGQARDRSIAGASPVGKNRGVTGISQGKRIVELTAATATGAGGSDRAAVGFNEMACQVQPESEPRLDAPGLLGMHEQPEDRLELVLREIPMPVSLTTMTACAPSRCARTCTWPCASVYKMALAMTWCSAWHRRSTSMLR